MIRLAWFVCHGSVVACLCVMFVCHGFRGIGVCGRVRMTFVIYIIIIAIPTNNIIILACMLVIVVIIIFVCIVIAIAIAISPIITWKATWVDGVQYCDA